MKKKSVLLWFIVLHYIVLAVCAAETWRESVSVDTGGLSRGSFPKGFVFGTATSAYQVEGMASKDGRGPSIWDVFVKIPGNIAKNGTGEVSVDQYHRYKVRSHSVFLITLRLGDSAWTHPS
eukprot:TRINITY_DN555_c2_g1_i3.p1 TRINITY_DN555_c2_g1~~TRINITY_DN555_c2_g1_i3.p1  ORF type:complete len:121 (+),score=1.25 TRINITY_DN555_c2_g1_i3:86-448(+)